MPRLYDYTKSSAGADVRIAQPHFGANEIEHAQLAKEHEIYPPGFGRHYQFSAGWKLPIEDFEAQMDEVFEWLSENNTGPWSWTEQWVNHGNSLHVFLHVERSSDQEVLNKTWGHLFKYSPDRDHELDTLAVLTGVLPPKRSLTQYLMEHGLQRDMNFFEKDEDGVDQRKTLIAADTPEKAALFQKDWGDLFKPYILGSSASEAKSTWIAVQSEQKAAIFIGDVHFVPDRPIPQDFMDYLEGRCDFSVVRTIHTGTASNMGLPAPDLACK